MAAVDVDLVEQQISNRLVAAEAMKVERKLPTARMRGDDGVAPASLQRGIDHADINLSPAHSVIAALG